MLRRSAGDERVKRLQQELKNLDFYTLEVDGVYGVSTENAVKAFQRSKGFIPDGIAGPQLYSALGISYTAEAAEVKTSDSGMPVGRKVLGNGATREEPIAKEPKGNKLVRSQLFISYSHKDKRWLDRLKVHLEPLKKQFGVAVWDDQLIKPGAIWKKEIKQGLDSAKVAILLISADFLASGFITTEELPSLLAAAQSEGTVIVPVIVSPCRFVETPSLSQFQAVNIKALSEMPKARQEATLVRVAAAVVDAFKA